MILSVLTHYSGFLNLLPMGNNLVHADEDVTNWKWGELKGGAIENGGCFFLFPQSFLFLVFGDFVLVDFDFIVSENGVAGYDVWLIFLRWLEGNIVA